MAFNRKAQEKKLLLMEELHRRRTEDPLARFEPHPKQREFINAVLKGGKSGYFFFAANRAGKSDAGAYIGASLARYGDQSDDVKWARGKGSSVSVRDRATSGWVVSLDFPASRDIVQPKYFDNKFVPGGATHPPFIPDREIEEWRAGDQILRLRNGSIIGFKSAESGRKKFQGSEKDWVQFDEEPPKEIFEETVIRVGARQLRTFATCTLLPPEGQIGGVTWMFSDIIKPFQQGKRPDLEIMTAAIYDNPHIPEMELARLESMYPEGSIQRRIRLNGELLPGLSGARVYSGFDHRLHVRDIPDDSINMRKPLLWFWDFNVEPMVSGIAQRELGLFRIWKEIILEEGSIPDMCNAFRHETQGHMGEVYLYGDATGKHRSHHSKQTSYQLILNSMQQYGMPIRMRVPETNPSVTSRINAVNRMFRDELGEARVEIDPSCTELIADFEQVISDGRGGIKKTYNSKDSYFYRTHISDAYGYMIGYEEPVRATETSQRSQKVVRIPRPTYNHRRSGG